MRTSVALSAEAGSGGAAGASVGPWTTSADVAAHRDRPIDLVHLARQTFGDKRLETELLCMFMRQAEQIQASLDDIAADRPGAQSAADLLHMLLGSSRAVGATQVATLAQAFEAKLRRDDPEGAGLGVVERAELRAAVARVNAFIAVLLEPA